MLSRTLIVAAFVFLSSLTCARAEPVPARAPQAAVADTAPAAAYPEGATGSGKLLSKVSFRNAAPYTDAELLAFTGLHPGLRLAESTLPDAARRLLDTGLFDDAQVLLDANGLERQAVITLHPSASTELLEPSFANFVWWTPEELDAALRARVPLYRGRLPDGGPLPEAVRTALEAMLASKGIHATLAETVVEPSTTYPARVLDFRVTEPTVRLASAALSGAPVAVGPALQAAIDRARLQPYNEGVAPLPTSDPAADPAAPSHDLPIAIRLLTPLHNTGYLGAELADVHRSPVTGRIHGVGVDYSARVVPGPVYTVAAIEWQPTPVYTAADFARDNTLHVGDIARTSAVTALESHILHAYGEHGYLDALVNPQPELDTAAHTVRYDLQAVPGGAYVLGTLDAHGLSPDARRSFDSAWTLHRGDPYNQAYVDSFLKDPAAQHGPTGYVGTYDMVADPESHRVDLTLRFRAASATAHPKPAAAQPAAKPAPAHPAPAK